MACEGAGAAGAIRRCFGRALVGAGAGAAKVGQPAVLRRPPGLALVIILPQLEREAAGVHKALQLLLKALLVIEPPHV